MGKADLILISHDHGDHNSKADVQKLSGPKTVVLAGFDGSPYTRIRPGESKSFDALTIEAVPAYNVKKTQFHPLGQTYTMDSVDEAVQAALDVKAKIAVPYHYGLYEGTAKDADDFIAALSAKGVKALRLKKQ